VKNNWEPNISYKFQSIGNRKYGEYDNLIMGKTISLGTTCYLVEIIGNRMGNMTPSLWGRPFHWEQCAEIIGNGKWGT
jgi:hypothetical protein